MIDIAEAHFWYTMGGKFEVHAFLSPSDKGRARRDVDRGVLWLDDGASYMEWKNELDDEKRLRMMLEMIPDLALAYHVPVNLIIREMAKVSQFRKLAATSWYIARAINAAEGRTAIDDLTLGGTV